MSFLLRLLILIILGGYLLGRYGPYVRQQFLGAHLADEQQRLPALAKNGQMASLQSWNPFCTVCWSDAAWFVS